MSEERVGDNFGGPGLDSRPKVGDDRVSAAIEESDRKESDKRYDKAKERFYSSLGMKPPKEGEPDAIMSGGVYLPGQAPVTLPDKSKKAEKPAKSAKSEREEKRDRKSQPPLRQAEPESEEIEEEPADEAEPVDADDVQEDVEADAEEETTDEDVSSESEEKEEESDDEDSSSDLDEETTILRRAQIPMSVIKKMTRAESRRMAEIERVRQAHADDLGRQLGEAKKKESGDKPSAESGSVTPTEQPAKRTSVEPLLGILGDDAAPALTEYDKTIDDRVDSLRKELSAVYLDDLLVRARGTVPRAWKRSFLQVHPRRDVRPGPVEVHKTRRAHQASEDPVAHGTGRHCCATIQGLEGRSWRQGTCCAGTQARDRLTAEAHIDCSEGRHHRPIPEILGHAHAGNGAEGSATETRLA